MKTELEIAKAPEQPKRTDGKHSALEVLLVSAKLGLTSFGGPTAHLGYFREEYIVRRKWLDDRRYADLVALCQFLPGPASSQVGMGIGMLRAGIPGALAAWIGFTLPSVIILIAFAMLFQTFELGQAGWIHGLKIAAVAIVAQAVYGMGRNLAPDGPRAAIAIATAAVVLFWHSVISQLVVIAAAGIMGMLLHRGKLEPHKDAAAMPSSKAGALAALGAFFTLLILLPVLRLTFPSVWMNVLDSFYRAGALVFGGGHVVLPLLEREVVPTGWMMPEQFIAGYGMAQAVPGPLFTFASYLGTMIGGWAGAILATVAIFLPAFLLVVGVLPFWETLRTQPKIQSSLWGINAAVVGILLAALYDPVWTSAIRSTADFSLALVVFALLTIWKQPPWVAVLIAALGGTFITSV